MVKRKTIIFFSRYLGNSGSEILLKKLLNELVKDNNWKIILVGFSDGPISMELNLGVEYISFMRYQKRKNRFFYRQLRRFAKKKTITIEDNFFSLLHTKFPGATWVLNTLAMSLPLGFASRNQIPLIMWVHEMDFFFYRLNSESVNFIQTVPKKIICVSEAVRNGLVKLNPKGNMKVIYPGMFFLSELKNFQKDENQMRTLGSRITIAMAGTLDANKNPLYLFNLAQYLKKKNDLRFKLLWIGGSDKNGMFAYLKEAIQMMDLTNFINFKSHQKDGYYKTLSGADLFLLTSYKDSFPLVMLEAASLGIPIIGWRSGGITEFVTNEEIGRILPNRNLEELYNLLSGFAEGKVKFNRKRILQRSRDFLLNDFVEKFKNEL